MTTLILADAVRLSADEHGAVLLNTHDGRMYGLNPAAAVFCRALADGADRESATNAVIEAFDAEETAIRTDLDALAVDLADHGLLRESP